MTTTTPAPALAWLSDDALAAMSDEELEAYTTRMLTEHASSAGLPRLRAPQGRRSELPYDPLRVDAALASLHADDRAAHGLVHYDPDPFEVHGGVSTTQVLFSWILDGLTERQREVAEALILEGLSEAVLAVRLDLSRRTVRTHKDRALAHIRSRITERPWLVALCGPGLPPGVTALLEDLAPLPSRPPRPGEAAAA
jgi:ATP/maltotriose-dependent transcriptional regulator MalT